MSALPDVLHFSATTPATADEIRQIVREELAAHLTPDTGMTADEVCRTLKCGRTKLTEMERDGTLVPWRHGKSVAYSSLRVYALLRGGAA